MIFNIYIKNLIYILFFNLFFILLSLSGITGGIKGLYNLYFYELKLSYKICWLILSIFSFLMFFLGIYLLKFFSQAHILYKILSDKIVIYKLFSKEIIFFFKVKQIVNNNNYIEIIFENEKSINLDLLFIKKKELFWKTINNYNPKI